MMFQTLIKEHVQIWNNEVSKFNHQELKCSAITDVRIEEELTLGSPDELESIRIFVVTLQVGEEEYDIYHAEKQKTPQWLIEAELYNTHEYRKKVELTGFSL